MRNTTIERGSDHPKQSMCRQHHNGALLDQGMKTFVNKTQADGIKV